MRLPKLLAGLCSWLLLAGTCFPASPAAAGKVTYTKDVAPILFKHCAGCHRPGEVGPFSLLTYADAAKRADFLVDITRSRRMPPWKPVPGYGDFVNVRRLSDAEISTLAAWTAGGALEGDLKDLPPTPSFPGNGWQMGEPDMVLKMAEPFNLPASGRDAFRCFVIPLDLASDKVVSGVEFHPGNRRVVHHALFYLDNTGKARKLDEASPGYGYASFGGVGFAPTGGIGGWAPGAGIRKFPEGMGNLIRKGSDLVLQVHYHPDGKPEVDQSELGVYFVKGPVRHIVASLALGNRDISIAPGDADYRLTSTYTLPADIRAVGISPHMHWLGRDMRVEAVLPGGRTEHLIWIKDWDFNWQGQYVYRQMIDLPKGTQLKLTASFDNSAANAANPSDPPAKVKFGEQTTDEMCFCWVQFVAERREDYVDVIKGGWRVIFTPRWLTLPETSKSK
jgi:hypothetical protein